MNSQELETAKRLGTSYINIVFNDNDYGLISWKQQQHRQRSVSKRIQNPDFKKYSESFGIPGYRPETLRELSAVLKKALDTEKLCQNEVPITYNVNNEFNTIINSVRRYKSYTVISYNLDPS